MQFQPGDVVKRPGPWGTDHLGLFAGVDVLGRQWVIHNAKYECVKWDLLESFAAGSSVSLVRRAPNDHEGAVFVARAQSFLGRRFDLVNFNCEHFVSCATAGNAVSPQLRSAVVGLAVLATLGFLVNSSPSA
jgi:hypothetical protein